MSKNHLPRSAVVQEIYSTCKQYALIGSGKTSLLQLLEEALENQGSKVIRLTISDVGPALRAELAHEGIVNDKRKLEELKPTWLLLDDGERTEVCSVLAVFGESDVGLRHPQ
jgi:adenylylsulfate kinase-like enzyme